MATPTDDCGSGSNQTSRERTGTSSWAGIVGGGKSDTNGNSSKPTVEEKPLNNECLEMASGEEKNPTPPVNATSNSGGAPEDELDPEELSQFTEIRNKKDRFKKKEGVRGGRRDRRGLWRRQFVDHDPRLDKYPDGVGRGRGGSKRGSFNKELSPKHMNGPLEGEEHPVENAEAATEPEVEEEKVQYRYVPAPVPSVNIWEKRQGTPTNKQTAAKASQVQRTPKQPTPSGGKYTLACNMNW